jgi:branched-chain amino acid transport system substrate-binding protein
MRLSKTIYQACLIITVILFTSGIAYARDPSHPGQSVKIGLLIQDSSWTSAVHGAELAISDANKNGSLKGSQFQLVVRSMEGPWGTGSKQAVNLIFEEQVVALVGIHDGRNAHLVEQAATKSQVVFLSAWPGDPTLSQAFVPWFFNCVPNDNQQATAIFKEIYEIKKYGNIVVVHEQEYDSEKSFASFINIAMKSGKPAPLQYSIKDYLLKPDLLADKISASDADCLILFCEPPVSLNLVRQIKKKNHLLPLYGPIALLNENILSSEELKDFDNVFAVPADKWPEAENEKFRKEFEIKYGYEPGMVASYSYDCMRVLIEAIKQSGDSDREMIQNSLKNIRFNGLTGPVQFDNKGNRLGEFEMMKTRNGLPLTLKTD